MSGLLIGAKKGMPEDLQEDFRRVGIIHLVVLSGYNITIIAENIGRAVRLLPIPYFLSSVLSVLGIILFAILTGASATIVRASIMAILVLFARSTGRIYEVTYALFIAGFFMIVHNPKIVRFDASFQLSFLATLGLIYLPSLLEKHFHWITPRFQLRDFALATIATQDVGNGQVAVGTARIHKGDVPSRKLGRTIAEQRLAKFVANDCMPRSQEAFDKGFAFSISEEALVKLIKANPFIGRRNFDRVVIDRMRQDQ